MNVFDPHQLCSRRDALRSSACGFGSLALASLLARDGQASATHFAPKAKRVIFLFMHGGVSQMDSFDYKPTLNEQHGNPLPFDLPGLIRPILQDQADVVFGSRFMGGGAHRVVFYWHMLGNKFLTTLSNMTTNLNLTDMECCYKIFRKSVVDQIRIEENRFGVEPELTAKVARLGVRIYEVGISYYGRTYAEGKKIGWRDGMRAVYAILKYGVVCRRSGRGD